MVAHGLHPDRTLVAPSSWTNVFEFTLAARNNTLPRFLGAFTYPARARSELTLLLPVSESLEPEIEFPWLLSFRNGKKEARGVEALKRLIDAIDPLLSAGRFDTINKITESLDATKYSSEFLVGMLRYTYPARQSIQSWQAFRQRVNDEFAKRELDVPKVLRGL